MRSKCMEIPPSTVTPFCETGDEIFTTCLPSQFAFIDPHQAVVCAHVDHAFVHGQGRNVE